MTTTKVNDSLPFDIMNEIFYRLPVKSLLRFRCLSKLHRVMIDDPKFIGTHNTRLSRTLLFGSDDYFICPLEEKDRGNLRLTLPCIYKPRFLCSAQGFLLFLKDDELCLCNLSRRESIILPSVPIDIIKNLNIFAVGLGFDSSIKEYKIVIPYIESAIIYSSKTKLWKKKNNTPPLPFGNVPPYHFSGVFVRGSIHWIYYYYGGRHRYGILSFDVMAEEFSVYNDISSWDAPALMELGGYLAIAEREATWGNIRMENVLILAEGKWKLKNIVNMDRKTTVYPCGYYYGYYYVNDEGLEWTSSVKSVTRGLFPLICRCKETLLSVKNF